MNRFDKLALPVALGCTLAGLGIGALALAVITIGAFVPTAELPFFYFQKLNFPMLSVLLPVVGMSALLPVVLRYAFGKETAEAAAPVAVPVPNTAVQVEEQHLKAA
jgi:hypothetical protein